MTKRSRSGWTLIELLIVIAVIALLMGILLAVYMRGRGSARQTICINNLRGIAQALTIYREDNGGYPLPYNAVTGEGGVSQLVIDRYVTDSSSLRCPLDTTNVDTYLNVLHPGMSAPQQALWRSELFSRRYSSYNEYAVVGPLVGDVYNGGPGPITGLYRLYNYWGYNAQGQSLADSVAAAALYSPLSSDIGKSFWDSTALPAPGKPAPTFPGLANQNAPSNTVITHCPFHRHPGAAPGRTELVARVGGSAENLDASAYDWIRQPR